MAQFLELWSILTEMYICSGEQKCMYVMVSFDAKELSDLMQNLILNKSGTPGHQTRFPMTSEDLALNT